MSGEPGSPSGPRSIFQRPVPPEHPRASSKAALVDAAYAEFSARGYEAATLTDIAARAGVTTGAIYSHFSGKLDLLLEVVGLLPVGDIRQTIGDLGDRPWSEAAPLLVQSLAARPDRRTQLALEVVVMARRDAELREVLHAGLGIYLDAVRRSADAGAELGRIDPALPTDDLARVLSLLNMGMLVFAALGERAPTEAAFGRVVQLLLQPADEDPEEDPAALARVRTRAAAVDRATRSLHQGIVEALAEGLTLRQVGEAAGLSHERVRQVARKHRDG